MIKWFVGLAILSLTAGFAEDPASFPDVSKVGYEAVKKWADERVALAERDWTATGVKRQASPQHWSQLVYQIQVDRFNNGDPSNDELNIKDDQKKAKGSADLFGLPNWRHGGDLQGVIDRLPYVKDLGVTTVWITPVMKHDGSYHGYCTVDFTDIDPGFGSREKLRELVTKAHDMGLYVVLDLVVNHLCDPGTSYSSPPNHVQCANELNLKTWNGEEDSSSSSQGTLEFSDNFFKPLKDPKFFNRCGANTPAEIAGTDPVSFYGDFVAGMFDLNTRNKDFQEIFLRLTKFWIAYADIDGLRLDAVKHVTEDFLAHLSTNIRDYANSIGKDNFFVVGEAVGNEKFIGRRIGSMFHNLDNLDQHDDDIPKSLTPMIKSLAPIFKAHPNQKFPGMTSAYDFHFSGDTKGTFLSQKTPKVLENYLKSDAYNTLKQADPRDLWTQLEIHDWPRFLENNPNDWGRVLAGLAFIMTMPGSPIIYYGLEQGFNGNCNFDKINAGAASDSIKQLCQSYDDSRKRQDMFSSGPFKLKSAISSIDQFAEIGPVGTWNPVSWDKDPMLDRSHTLYKTVKKIAHLRQSCPALREGTWLPRFFSDDVEGLIAYSRISGNAEHIILINPSLTPKKIPELQLDPKLNPKGTFVFDALQPIKHAGYTTEKHGNAYLTMIEEGATICGYCVKIFISEHQMGNYVESEDLRFCSETYSPVVPQPLPGTSVPTTAPVATPSSGSPPTSFPGTNQPSPDPSQPAKPSPDPNASDAPQPAKPSPDPNASDAPQPAKPSPDSKASDTVPSTKPSGSSGGGKPSSNMNPAVIVVPIVLIIGFAGGYMVYVKTRSRPAMKAYLMSSQDQSSQVRRL